MKARMEKNLRKRNYPKCHELYRTLEQLSAIQHISVERIVRDGFVSICKHFVKESSIFKEHCHLAAFDEAEDVLMRLQEAAAVFHGVEWEEVLSLDQLVAFYSRARAKHTEQIQRDEALQHQLRQAGNQIDLLTAALEAQKEEAIHKERVLLEQFEVLRKELAEQLQASEALFQSTQKALQEELSARLLAKEEESQLAKELQQQDEIVRLSGEKAAIELAYQQQLDSSKRKYEAELRAQQEKEKASLLVQERALEEARKEKEAAELRIKELQDIEEARKEADRKHALELQVQRELEQARQDAVQKSRDDARKQRQLQAQKEEEERAAKQKTLDGVAMELQKQQHRDKIIAKLNLLEIAQNGDDAGVALLQELDKLGALAAVPDINKLYSFAPPGDSARVSLLAFVACSMMTLR